MFQVLLNDPAALEASGFRDGLILNLHKCTSERKGPSHWQHKCVRSPRLRACRNTTKVLGETIIQASSSGTT
jgi:hypothetical protein